MNEKNDEIEKVDLYVVEAVEERLVGFADHADDEIEIDDLETDILDSLKRAFDVGDEMRPPVEAQHPVVELLDAHADARDAEFAQ